VSDDIRSLCTVEGYNPSLNPFHDYLVDLRRKIIWTTFFDHSSDFAKECDTFMRIQTIIDVSLSVFYYIHHSGMHAEVYDKLLRALTASEL